MSAPKSKSAPAANGSAKGKGPSTSGTATPLSATADKDTVDQLTTFAGGRPDKAAYDADQNRIKSEIDTLQSKLNEVRDKISFATKSGGGNDRRNALRAELDGLRDQQSSSKSSRGKTLDQVKALQEGVQKKIKDLQAAKSKINFKTVADVDAHIKNLEKQVESGNMKLAEEKRALQEISSLKRNRKTVEGFQESEDSIQADRQKIDELRKELDDPARAAINKRYDEIKEELDALKKESDVAYAGRNKLFEERDKVNAQIKALYDEKRESANRYREANDRYYAKLNEDRARRAERARAQRAAEEAEKKKEVAERLLEEAQSPAFQAQIEDCQTLIDFLSGKSTNVTYKSQALVPKAELAGIPKLEIRKVEDAPEGAIVRKKKGEEEESDYFFGGKGKGKGKGKKGGKPAEKKEAAPSPASSALNIPLPTLTALLSLSIPPPANNADVPRVIEDLNTKKAWFEANQARVTAENIAKAEKEIARLNKGEANVAVPPNGDGEVPAEPAPTPAVGDAEATPVSTEAVDDKLEAVEEAEKESS